MKTFEELQQAVLDYCESHGHQPKYTKCHPDEKYYYIEAMDFTQLEAKIVPMKNGKTKTTFKVDGKITSLLK